MRKFDFNEQLGAGDSGERDFKGYYKDLEPTKSVTDLKFDFTLKGGEKLELKTDTYDMDETPNFFMEYYSDSKNLKLGGPWRADNDSVDYFVYFFVKNKTFFWFKTKQLREFLDKYIDIYQPKVKNVPNKGWLTQGFAIPREALDEILIKKEAF
jgi:hypothetical protein